MGRFRTLDLLLDPWLILFLNIPALVIIILAFVWFGLNGPPPSRHRAQQDPQRGGHPPRRRPDAGPGLPEMARSFRLGWRKTLIYVVLPQLLPYLAVAARSGLP